MVCDINAMLWDLNALKDILELKVEINYMQICFNTLHVY